MSNGGLRISPTWDEAEMAFELYPKSSQLSAIAVGNSPKNLGSLGIY